MQSSQQQQPAAEVQYDERFCFPTYLVRRKFFKIFGNAFHIYDSNGQLAFYSKQKAFKLKEDIRVYADESMSYEVLLIKARNIIDFSAVYDVFDSSTGERVGALKRKGMKSILKDEWIFLDLGDQPIGLIKEDSAALALVRRFLINLVPQHFVGTIGDRQVCDFRQRFNPVILKVELDFRCDADWVLDRRLGIAAAILLGAIEGRQN